MVLKRTATPFKPRKNQSLNIPSHLRLPLCQMDWDLAEESANATIRTAVTLWKGNDRDSSVSGTVCTSVSFHSFVANLPQTTAFVKMYLHVLNFRHPCKTRLVHFPRRALACAGVCKHLHSSDFQAYGNHVAHTSLCHSYRVCHVVL